MKPFLLSLLAFILLMCSCRTEYIPVETVKYDSIFFSKLEKDSIFVRDSVFVREKGDTITKFKYQYIYRYVTNTDTVYISHTDSVQVPYPVERRLSWWERQKQDFGEALFGIVFVYMIYLLIRWIVKKRMSKE